MKCVTKIMLGRFDEILFYVIAISYGFYLNANETFRAGRRIEPACEVFERNGTSAKDNTQSLRRERNNYSFPFFFFSSLQLCVVATGINWHRDAMM